jgi:fermentation-respiration switch protein FrsA (DUF1100 family)
MHRLRRDAAIEQRDVHGLHGHMPGAEQSDDPVDTVVLVHGFLFSGLQIPGFALLRSKNLPQLTHFHGG